MLRCLGELSGSGVRCLGRVSGVWVGFFGWAVLVGVWVSGWGCQAVWAILPSSMRRQVLDSPLLYMAWSLSGWECLGGGCLGELSGCLGCLTFLQMRSGLGSPSATHGIVTE